MGLYALRYGSVATFCVHRTADPTLPVDPRGVIQNIYASRGWLIPRALEKCPPNSELYYDQVAQAVVPRWTPASCQTHVLHNPVPMLVRCLRAHREHRFGPSSKSRGGCTGSGCSR